MDFGGGNRPLRRPVWWRDGSAWRDASHLRTP